MRLEMSPEHIAKLRSVRYYGTWLAQHERTHTKSLPGLIARVT